jgi:hypothetical protein
MQLICMIRALKGVVHDYEPLPRNGDHGKYRPLIVVKTGEMCRLGVYGNGGSTIPLSGLP